MELKVVRFFKPPHKAFYFCVQFAKPHNCKTKSMKKKLEKKGFYIPFFPCLCANIPAFMSVLQEKMLLKFRLNCNKFCYFTLKTRRQFDGKSPKFSAIVLNNTFLNLRKPYYFLSAKTSIPLLSKRSHR